ncbi:uncharacterized protein F4822DRAFT_406969 [Hypoxylon trugodes]|uniref:uncharacterized protein n=1 Tax=Hypoxylon trugodes TaxID=326681 RepID=UPI00219DD1E6|nr:uncharacterized protein F4822DRAFT_406969 [Hypoxylon trugodes]KAI1387573.1 hypothetical protein F4822DRAFT_406969 [Hypoxylon trugodes]
MSLEKPDPQDSLDSNDYPSTSLEPLLILQTPDNHNHGGLPRNRKSWGLDGLHLILSLLSIALLVCLIGTISTREVQSSLHAHSPARSVVRYETTYFEKYGHWSSPFSQKPSPELDAAWSKQLSGMNIRVSREWLEPYGVDSVHLADGSGVLAQLGVYHELHCLKKVKHWIYRSYYYGNTTTVNFEEEEAHIEHCLEWLRVAALCRGDTTLTTFRWEGKERRRLETEYPIPRTCVDAGRILKWSEEHAVDINQDGLLQES